MFFSWGGETVVKTVELPDSEELKIDDGFFDVGVLYKGIDIFFMPVWQYEMRYVGTNSADATIFYELNDDGIAQISADYGIEIPPISDVKLDFWTAWGGKIVLLVLLALVAIYFKWRKGLEDKDAGAA